MSTRKLHNKIYIFRLQSNCVSGIIRRRNRTAVCTILIKGLVLPAHSFLASPKSNIKPKGQSGFFPIFIDCRNSHGKMGSLFLSYPFVESVMKKMSIVIF